MRILATLLATLLAGSAHAASRQDYELNRQLNEVARQSSVGTPRAINADLLDNGYSVDGHRLINHIAVRQQLAASVCANPGYRQLLQRGAELVYAFSEYQSERPVTRERFVAADCGL